MKSHEKNKNSFRMAELSPEVAAIPLLNVQAGPRDADQWMERVKEEYLALIQYIKQNKERDNDWFKLKSNKYVNFMSHQLKIKCSEREPAGSAHVGIFMNTKSMNLKSSLIFLSPTPYQVPRSPSRS